MNPYFATMMAFHRARGIYPSGFPGVPMGAPAGSIAGRAPNPAYQQAYYQAPQQQGGPAAGVGIAGHGVLSQAQIAEARRVACIVGKWLGTVQASGNLNLTDHSLLEMIVAMSAELVITSSVTPANADYGWTQGSLVHLIRDHYHEWCVPMPARPHPGGVPVPMPHG